MRRRVLLGQATAAAAFAACSSLAPSTPKRVPRLGWIDGVASAISEANLAAFKDGLRDFGYVEGQTVRLERRNCICVGSPNPRFEFDAFATEFVAMPVDVIVVPVGGAPARWASETAKAIPIVTLLSGDDIASGIVATLARPATNVTGIATGATPTESKRLELLRDLAPGIKRVGFLSHAGLIGGSNQSAALDAARALEMDVVLLTVTRSDYEDLPDVLHLATLRGVDALVVNYFPFFIRDRKREIATYALERHIPLVGDDPGWAEAGGLLSFGNDSAAMIRRLAYFVDRILKGAKAGELPLEQPTRFETVINLGTGKAIGIAIPPSVRARATRFIE